MRILASGVKQNAGRILIVEDDCIIRTNTSELLRDEAYHVEEAADGFEALEVLETRRFDLVITDFAMRPLNGLTLLASTVKRLLKGRFLVGYNKSDSPQNPSERGRCPSS